MKTLLPGFLLAMMMSVMTAAADPNSQSGELRVFISSFASGADAAIQAFKLNPLTGKLNLVHRNAGVENPFFLAVSPDQRFLFAVDAKEFGGKEEEGVASFAISAGSGELKLLNRQSSRGTATCYLAVDATGKTVLVANYTSGSVSSLPVRSDGSLGPAAGFAQHMGSSVNSERQGEAHAHSFVLSPDNRFAFAADLGMDKILCYRVDAANAVITPGPQPFTRTPPGAGPRHLTFHPDGHHLYAINELANSVTVFEYDAATGHLIERQTISTVPAGYDGKSYCADVKITPDGQFLYGTNRGHDSIACYRIAADGMLTLIGIEPSLGKGPQNLAITPKGDILLCANMPGDNVSLFRIDHRSGRLTAAGTPVTIKSPSCIRILH